MTTITIVPPWQLSIHISYLFEKRQHSDIILYNIIILFQLDVKVLEKSVHFMLAWHFFLCRINRVVGICIAPVGSDLLNCG